MANGVEQLKEAIGAAARANKYVVTLNTPNGVSGDLNNADLLCRSTSFPSMSIGQVELFSQGRKLVIPGDTTFTNTWTVTFYQTEDHAIRRQMIEWMRSADHFQENSHSGSPKEVMGDLAVAQLDSAGNPTATYTFHNAFVQEVGEISLSDDTDSGAMEFDVTFSFTDWVAGTNQVQEPDSANDSTGNTAAE